MTHTVQNNQNVAQILVLTDHRETMESVAGSLEHYGHVVLKTNTSYAAKDILLQRTVDLVVGDIRLQNGDSIFDFLRWVKGDPSLRSIPFVCLNIGPQEAPKFLSEGVRTAARTLGAAKYITMEQFDSTTFRAEIEWLLPQELTGNYYASTAAGGDGHGSPL